MLTLVKVGQLVNGVKGSTGIPVRKLAADAHVAASTITRIQAGVVDPTVNTLEKILDAAGFDLRIEAIRHDTHRRPRLADLADKWTLRDGRVRVDWTSWRALLDELALHPERTPDAIYLEPPPAGTPMIDALLAAVAEKLADDAGMSRPHWTTQVPPLEAPYHPLRARHVGDPDVAPQLVARGLMIDTRSLWRDPETIGV